MRAIYQVPARGQGAPGSDHQVPLEASGLTPLPDYDRTVPRKTTKPKACASRRQWWIALVRKKGKRIGTLNATNAGAVTPSGSSPLTGRKRRGLRKPSADLVNKSIDETAAQVTRIGLTYLGTAAFCLLSLLTPDSALLGGGEKISVPFAGPVSYFGFMLLGPAVLIMLRVYLQIYVE